MGSEILGVIIKLLGQFHSFFNFEKILKILIYIYILFSIITLIFEGFSFQNLTFFKLNLKCQKFFISFNQASTRRLVCIPLRPSLHLTEETVKSPLPLQQASSFHLWLWGLLTNSLWEGPFVSLDGAVLS